MTVEYYQRILLSAEDRCWDAASGPGLWVETYRHRDDVTMVENLIAKYLSGHAQAKAIDEDERGLRLLEWFVTVLSEAPLSRIAELVRCEDYVLKGTVENVPQLSSYEDSTDGIVRLLSASEREMDFEEIGYHLNPNGKRASKVANIKYGENCAKFAALLDLVEIPRKKSVLLTSIGRILSQRPDGVSAFPRLFFRSELFRDFIWTVDEMSRQRFKETIGMLSASTMARRASAFSVMYKQYLRFGGCGAEKSTLMEVLWNMRH